MSLALSLLLSLDAYSQSIAGEWKGLLQMETIPLRVQVKISTVGDAYSGTMDILEQGARGLPIYKVNYSDSTLSFKFQGATYTGKLQPDGQFYGEFDGYLRSMPLNFGRGKWEIHRPQEPKPPFPYKVEEVRYTNASAQEVTLAGTLTLPDQNRPYPAVILITGSGANTRDEEILMHKPFWVIADYLSRHGVAVLRFDDRGVGKSTGKHAMATSADFATDVLAGVRYLKGRSDLNISIIGLLGHSEGGLIGSIAASASADVGFLVMLAGPGVRGDKLLAEQTTLVMRADSASEHEIGKARSANEELYHIIVQSRTMKEANQKLNRWMERKAKTDTTSDMVNMKRLIPQLNNVWFRYFLKHDPVPVLEKVKCPVLALNGEKDIQVPPELNLDAIAAALARGGNEEGTTMILPGLNHLFQHCGKCNVGEYAMIEETISPEVLEMVCRWILEKGR
jgi:pimeloyl-ACP methyl ester carboxylesterase